MQYKALLLDLDGTTVIPFKNNVSVRVREAIAKAHEKVFVSIATGRPLKYAIPVIEQLELSGLCIVDNGTQLYDPVKKEIIKELTLSKETLLQIHDRYKAEDVNIWISDHEGNHPWEKREESDAITGFVIADAPKERMPHLIGLTQDIPGITSHRMGGSTPDKEFLEVTHAGATKQLGIYEVAKRESINTHDIIGVGDSYNDFPLLLSCGLKIAMGNAVPELKAIADFVAPTVEEDGVAVVIEKFILSS